MCCIFTCCGWMIDLIQRAWVFAMSCCISSAVCCALITASMSGVALGYNYSLAEYIDLKETNVSVFLKRGVFDDEVVDEMDWRRGGGGMAAAQRRMNEQPTTTSVPDFPFKYRRGDDEGLFATTEADKPNTIYGDRPERHQFEGSLMKLTALPKHGGLKQPVTEDSQMARVMTGYPQGSMDQLKAVQGLINRRRMEGIPLASDENKGFIMPKPMLYGMESTESVPHNTYDTSENPWGVSDQMDVIQKLLNERKEAAKRFESMKRTKKTTLRPTLTGVFPEEILGSARRMGAPGSMLGPNSADLQVEQLQRAIDPNDANAPSKWYQPKPPKPTIDGIFTVTSARGPVTISQPSTTRTVKSKDKLLLSQDSYRRAMQENSKDKDDSEKELQQKDYDEEDVKGIPNRKKRKKRNRRNVPVATQIDKGMVPNNPIVENMPPLGNGRSLFSKLMSGLMRFKLLCAPEDEVSKVVHERKSSVSLPKASTGIHTLDTVSTSYVNVGLPSIAGISTLRLITSTLVS